MPNWKKVIISGSTAALSGLTVTGAPEFSGLSTQASETDVLTINGSNIVGTRTLGSNAFNSTTIGTTTNALTVSTGLNLNSGTTFNGSGAKTISVDVSDFMTNGLNNRIVTATGTDAMNAEANLTFNGSSLGVGAATAPSYELDVFGSIAVQGVAFAAWNSDIIKLGDFDGGGSKLALYDDNSAELVRLDDGKVGIGTTNPSEKLEVVGTIGASGNITGNSFVKSGGTSTQFLKADGSVDSSTYLTSLTGAVLTSGDQTASGTKTFSGTVKISNAVNAGFDTNKFLVLDTTDTIDFRTGAEVRADIDAAADGANSDITSLSGLTTALSVGQGGTGVTSLDAIALSSFDDDLDSTYVALTGNQSVAGTKTFTGQIVIGANGSTSAPMIRFPGTLTNTGFYASNPDEISITRAGSQAFKFDSNGFQQLVAGGTSQFAGHLQAHCLGIGGTPSTTSGEIWAYGDIVANKSSDRRLKKYIKNIKNPLDKLSKINGVTFEWKKADEKMKKEVHSHEGPDVGVIAQEVEEILPEIVATRDNGYKAVYYEKLIPLLIESVKELKAEVDKLKKSK